MVVVLQEEEEREEEEEVEEDKDSPTEEDEGTTPSVSAVMFTRAVIVWVTEHLLCANDLLCFIRTSSCLQRYRSC